MLKKTTKGSVNSMHVNLFMKEDRGLKKAVVTACMYESEVKVTQSCLTLCNPMDYIVHGILQARILDWVAFFFSRGSSQPRDGTQVLQVDSLPAKAQGKTPMYEKVVLLD